jgi:DNA mismatch repair protein MutS2
VEFDLETLSPTFRLSIGLPGTSQAFAIAERLGLRTELVEDARSRLSRAQQEFEQTLASIKVAQETAAQAVLRAGEAEARAREAQRSAELERARARRERDDAFMSAREEAERALARLREEIRAARAGLERETLTEARLDSLERGLDERLASLPGARRRRSEPAPPQPEAQPPTWQVGMEARSTSGWEGRITALDEGAERATLEAGGLRVTVPTAELLPLAPGRAAAAGGAPVPGERPQTGRRGELEPPALPARALAGAARAASSRAGTSASGGRPASGRATAGRGTSAPATAPRSVAATLDLRGARVDEALELLDQYLDQAAVAQAGRVTIVHGHGSGALRDAVREVLSGHPLVREWRPGERGEGGDGASVVSF